MSSGGPSLFVSYSGERGGAGRFLVDVVAGLPGAAVVACPPGPVADACGALGIPVVLLRERPLAARGGAGAALGAAGALAGHVREMRGLVRDLEPALLFTWGMRSALGAAVALAGLRGAPPWLARHHDFVPGPVAGAAVRRALGRADEVVVNSRAVRDDLRLGKPVEVILPGVDLDRFAPAPGSPPAGLLWLGAIVAWKRPDLALEVAARTPGARIRLAGAPLDAAGERLMADLRARASEPDLVERVELPGTVDPAEALASAELLLHTADREPFGIAVAEALASGVPVVAPAAGGPAEMVDERCGRLFRPGDARGAATAVAEVLSERTALAKGARARAEDLLDLGRARESFAALIERHRGAAKPRDADGRDLAFVTVTHNSQTELDALLRSVARHLPAAQVVVADSGSSDDSLAVALRHGAETVELENVGYGAAANAGLARVTRPITIVLNPDVELVDGSVAELAGPAAAGRLVVPAVVLPDGARQDVAQHEPASGPLVVFALLPPALLPPPLRPAIEPWRARRPRRAGWGVGACLAGATETLRALGPFDPEIFLYAEDLDLGLRARDAGVETWFWPSARVLHKRAHATRHAFGGEPFELLARRRRAVIEARRGRARARLDDLLQTITFADRIALKTLTRRDTTRERRQLAALRAARRSG